MAVLGAYSLTLEVPDTACGTAFYRDAGFEVDDHQNVANIRCIGDVRPSIVLIGGADRKRLHHITLRADPMEFAAVRERASKYGGKVVEGPPGFSAGGLWVEDMHGMLIHLVDAPADQDLPPVDPFRINQPGHVDRIRKSALRARSETAVPRPLRLGHILLFTPDVAASVAFVTNVLGMGLADRAQDIIAFCCARKNSQHHVVAFAKSPGVGFHHASFEMRDPDEVGRAGAALAERAKRGQWGFGRHTIGSNFFHYIQDPWGSWFEYFSDMDFIDDHSLWSPTNYEMEDSLANWAPTVPHDFVHNYEVAPEDFAQAVRASL